MMNTIHTVALDPNDPIIALTKSKIHISFDLWTSPNIHAIIAVVAHFLSPELQLRHVLLAVREIEGSHSGENMAESLLTVITDYEISTRIGVFVSDNASSNDVATRTILSQLEIDDNSSHRARCLGHIINLAAQAFILGKDCEVFSINAEAAERTVNVDSSRLSDLQRIWRAKGPIGKFHNVVTFIRATPQRRQLFAECIRRSSNERDDLTVILDNSTRWNSIYNSINRGLRLKSGIQLFLLENEANLVDDCLQNEEWEQLEVICTALKPFNEVTLHL
jgi:hypothetical protein